MDAFKRMVRVGVGPYGPIYITIEYQFKDRKGVPEGCLSITGVEGPLANGDCKGGCGQIDSNYKHRNPKYDYRSPNNPNAVAHLIPPEEIQFEGAWTAEMWQTLLDIWYEWHFNDLRAGCEHQRDEEWGFKWLKVTTYRLKPEIFAQRYKLEDDAKVALRQGKAVQYTDAERALMALVSEFKAPAGSEVSEEYYPHLVEDKLSTWVRPDEHPEGVLAKPCPVCGYKYGSAWKYEPVPENTLLWLSRLPVGDADKCPSRWAR